MSATPIPDPHKEALDEAERAQDIYRWAALAWNMSPEQVDADLADAGLQDSFFARQLAISERASYRAHLKAEAARHAVALEILAARRKPNQMLLL